VENVIEKRNGFVVKKESKKICNIWIQISWNEEFLCIGLIV
jgi:hypothetical protein